MRRADRGFSILETMVALTILLISLGGAIGGLLSASQNITEGQMRQYKAALAEEYTQKYLLVRRDQLGISVPVSPLAICSGCGNLDQVAIGGAGWTVEGAWKIMPAAGVVATATLPGSCATVPVGTYCREVSVTNRLPNGTAPAQGNAFTVWARVVRGGEPATSALLHREVLIQ
jgi:prepilin-type N-terminal cleavage/methylation domain-containing protein